MIWGLKPIEFDGFFCCKILGVRAHDVEGFPLWILGLQTHRLIDLKAFYFVRLLGF